MRCDGIVQCGDLSDEDGCNWVENSDMNEMGKTNSGRELQFVANQVRQVRHRSVQPPQTEYNKDDEIYKKCMLSGTSNSFAFNAPDVHTELLHYLPSSKKHLPPAPEHLTSIEIFQCCTIPNYFILGSMVCDGIVQCPDMSDECVCFVSSTYECT